MLKFKVFFKFIYDIFKTNKIYLFTKAFLAVLQGIFPVITTILPQYLLDAILIDHNLSYFFSYVVLYVVLQFFVPFIYSIIEIYLEKLLFKVNLQVTNEMLDKIYYMRYENYDNPENSNIINRAFRFATGAGINTFNVFLEMIALAITLCSYAYIIARFNIFVLLFVLISVSINYLLMLKKTKRNVAFNDEHTQLQRRIGYYKNVLLNKTQARDIHFAGTFESLKTLYNSRSYEYNCKLVKKNLCVFGLNQIGSFFQNILILAIMVSFGILLYDGKISVGEYTVSLNASTQFSTILFSFINYLSNVYSGVLEGKNYSEFILLTKNCLKKKSNISLDSAFKVDFDNVSYQYFGTEFDALHKFSYSFVNGKIYAILGNNGSGKSTLVKLLLGLYKPSAGKIMINEYDLESIDLSYFYDNLSVLAQDFCFVEGMSIKENLNINTSSKKKLFCKLAEKYEISGLIDSNIEFDYSKSFDENGVELSGGEKQKLGMIRALLKDKKIMIFDEPTSSIDPENEERFFSSLKSIATDRLCIFITHNHKMAQYADEILLMENGVLMESGTYDDLKDKNLLYNVK